MKSKIKLLLSLSLAVSWVATWSDGGVVKDLFQKITNSNNQTEDIVKQSAPICGSGIFSTPNESDLSPELILITNRAAKSEFVRSSRPTSSSIDSRSREVAKEFRFHVENVTLDDLERNGFNRKAPVTFLIHGFTSGYPLQAWISAIVEAYTIERQSKSHEQVAVHGHNLFIVNWHYAARGIVYPRAVANIPIVASYITKFINERLLDQAQVDPNHMQLVGHSLGAHLSGYIGKNTRQPLGRIYGLDPAGPCFGSISGSLFPTDKRLAPNDAQQVISVHTNSDLLGIDQALGKYSVFVEGGARQPGCKGGGILKSISSLTLDGADTVDLSCSHSRAPNLLTHWLDQSAHSEQDQQQCQLVAYQCSGWASFIQGRCGVCHSSISDQHRRSKRGLFSGSSKNEQADPLSPVQCLRIGLDWQYSSGDAGVARGHHHQDTTDQNWSGTQHESNPQAPNTPEDPDSHNHNIRPKQFSTRRPSWNKGAISNGMHRNQSNSRQTEDRSLFGRNKNHGERRENAQVEPIKMFLRTGDTQPYCTYHYQVILKLEQPFPERQPEMQLILQDSESSSSTSSSSSGHKGSLSSDNFGRKFDEHTYTDLLISGQRLGRVDHATVLFRKGLDNGHQHLKRLHINYMSHSNPDIRRRLSSELCTVLTDTDRGKVTEQKNIRYYFEPCRSSNIDSHDHSSSHNHFSNDQHNNHSVSGHQNNHDHYKSHSSSGYSQRDENQRGTLSEMLPERNNHSQNRNSSLGAGY